MTLDDDVEVGFSVNLSLLDPGAEQFDDWRCVFCDSEMQLDPDFDLYADGTNPGPVCLACAKTVSPDHATFMEVYREQRAHGRTEMRSPKERKKGSWLAVVHLDNGKTVQLEMN